MLSLKVVEEFVQRMGLNEMNFSLTDKDEYGDIIAALDPDTDFSVVREAINNYTPYSRNIVDNGLNFYQIDITTYVDGVKTNVAFLCSKNNNGNGTLIKVRVKSLVYSFDGNVKVFTGFRAMEEYKKRFIVD